MANLLLYILTIAIWGASWIGLTFQFGVVPPDVSVVYRFILSSIIMFVFCIVTGRSLRFRRVDHGWIALQGAFLFSANFYLIYLGAEDMTSGLVAVIFSLLSIIIMVLGALVFGNPVRPRVAAGAAVGFAGIILVFWPEVRGMDLAGGALGSIGLCVAGTFSAAIGMLISGRNQVRGLPLAQTTAFGMAYGAGFSALFSLSIGSEFTFEPTFEYVASLAYLAIFAGVIAFWSYLTLLGRIGADRAAYASVLFPIVALALSTWLEGYQWTVLAAAGVSLVVFGNVLVLSKVRAVEKPHPTTQI